MKRRPPAPPPPPATRSRARPLAIHKLNPGWRPGRKRRRRQLAATMIQRCFRSFLLRRAFRQSRHAVRDSFAALRAFHHARDRRHYRRVDLHRLSREELRLIALSLNVPSTGKKVLLLGRIQRWLDQNLAAKDLAVDAAARAREKQLRAQGTVYFAEAIPTAEPIEIRPLRGKNIARVAAGHECDAVYAIDGQDGAVWLCRTGGLASQVGLCSELHRTDVFAPPLESQWLVSPVFLHTLRADHIIDVQVARGHAAARARAGELYAWGDNPHGELGFPALSADHVARNRATAVGAIAQYVAVSVALGTSHTVAVCDAVAGRDGVVYAWGSNTYGQLGQPPTATSTTATPTRPRRQSSSLGTTAGNAAPPAPSPTATFPRAFTLHQLDALRGINVRKVACGSLHTLAVSADGRVFAWGCNDGGRLGLGPQSSRVVSTPTPVDGPLDGRAVLDVACGAWHSCCLVAVAPLDEASSSSSSPSSRTRRRGRVYTWGTGIYGQLGAGHAQVLHRPTPVRLPVSSLAVDEEFAVALACGMHHTAALTEANAVLTWGSLHSFSSTPTRLRLAGGRPLGRIASLACGRTFTVLNTLSLSAASYERAEAPRLWRTRETVIPRLDLALAAPRVPLSSSLPGVDVPLPQRLEPKADRLAREAAELAERERLEALDLDKLIHPLCRVCWRCDGFQPSPLRLWSCRRCFHGKELHGPRPAGDPLGEYEAVRKIQCLFRARRAKRVLQAARERRYQRVFSIRHDAFFYYNLWRGTASWARPPEVPLDVEIPIRDPDELPQLRPPLTPLEAAVCLQRHARGFLARRRCLGLLRGRYEKHYDLQKERVYYKVLPNANDSSSPPPRAILWEPPWLLRRRYDLGEPIEILRLRRYANLSPDDAARVLQRRYRCHVARRRLKRVLQSRIRKLLDEASGQYFYYNTLTHESTWEKPRLLADDEDLGELGEGLRKHSQHSPAKQPPQQQSQQQQQRRRRPRPEKFATPDAAARTIQALVRRFLGRRVLHELLRRRYRKLLDPTTQRPYYYDRVAGVSTWLKPVIFGARFDLELETPTDTTTTTTSAEATTTAAAAPERARATALIERRKRRRRELPSITERARVKREKRRLQKLQQSLTPPVAAGLIQRNWRAWRARAELRRRLQGAYEKIYDETTGHYYYHNKLSGHVSWERPALLAEDEVRVARLQRRRREHTITDRVEAATVVGGFLLRCRARKELHGLLRERIQKVFDPETRSFYYFDKVTGQSSWKKPVTLGDGDL